MIKLPNLIQKRCSHCGKLFTIGNEMGRVTEHSIHFFPCTHCNHVDATNFNEKYVKRRKWTELKRCVHCFIPFSVSKHYAYGKCKACHEKKRRSLKKSNTTHTHA